MANNTLLVFELRKLTLDELVNPIQCHNMAYIVEDGQKKYFSYDDVRAVIPSQLVNFCGGQTDFDTAVFSLFGVKGTKDDFLQPEAAEATLTNISKPPVVPRQFLVVPLNDVNVNVASINVDDPTLVTGMIVSECMKPTLVRLLAHKTMVFGTIPDQLVPEKDLLRILNLTNRAGEITVVKKGPHAICCLGDMRRFKQAFQGAVSSPTI